MASKATAATVTAIVPVSGVSAVAALVPKIVNGTSAAETLSGSSGIDEIFGLAQNDLISSGDGNDTLWGGAGNDTLDGGAGDDLLIGESGDDQLDGGLGSDSYRVTGNAAGGFSGYDTYLDSGASVAGVVDTIVAVGTGAVDIGFKGNFESTSGIEAINASGAAGLVRLLGENSAQMLDFRGVVLTGANIVIDAANGNDTVFGSASNDTVLSGFGNDVMDGAGGADVYSVSGNASAGFQDWDTYKDSGTAGTDKIVVSGTTTGAVDIGIRGWSATGIETVDATGTTGVVRLLDTGDANLIDLRTTTLTGSNLVIDANYGNDTVYGSAAADTIVGGSGNDVLDGGAGGDTYRVTGNEAGGWGSFHSFDTYADTGPSTSGTDRIVALGTGNVDIGFKGNFGPASGIEIIDATGATGNVRLLGDSSAQTLDLRGVTLTGTRIVIDAGNGNDVVYGSGAADTLASHSGEDTVDGAGGADTYRVTGSTAAGFHGYDTYKDSGTAGADKIVAVGTGNVDIGIRGWSATGIETVDATGTTGVARLLDTGDANLIDLRTTTLKGSNLVIDANYGNDTVYGSAAADTIVGGSGDDVLNGGVGGDTYRVTGNEAGGWSSFHSYDTYQDTGTSGTDKIAALGTGNVDIGFKGNFGPSNGIEAIDATGATGTVRLLGDGSNATLDFRNVALTGANIVIDGAYGHDVLYGSAQDNVIVSGWGDDTVDGAGGSDTYRITGNTTTGFQGYDVYKDSGTSGKDKIVALGTGDVDIGFKGNFGPASGIEIIDATGATGNVRLLGDSSAQTLDLRGVTLTGTRIVIDAGNGNDVVYGSGAADTLASHSGEDTVDGAGGADTYRVTGSTAAGFHGYDTYKDSGTSGTDRILVTGGALAVDIGIKGWNATGIEQVDASGTTGVVRLLDTGDANLLDFSAVTFVGGNVLIDGAYGNDTIKGSAGADVIQGGADVDRLDGQNGSDTYRVTGNRPGGWSSFHGFDLYADTGTSGTDTVVALGMGDVDIGVAGWKNTGIEVVDATSATGTVRLLGQDSADELDFRGTTLIGGNLVIDGAYGNDTIFGSAGADTIVGAGNDDLIDGASGGDTFRVTGNAAGGWSSFHGYDTYRDTGTAGTDRLVALGSTVDIGLAGWQNTGVEVIDATGATGTVRLLGGDGATLFDFRTTTLTGGNLLIDSAWSNDTVYGSAGADRIVAGGGDDTFDGFDGDDTYLVTGNFAEGWRSFQGFDTYLDSGTVGIDTLLAEGAGDVDIGMLYFDAASGIEVIDTTAVVGQTRILGSWSDDVLDFSATSIVGSRVILDGSGGTDVIFGSAGNDTILGGTGADSMAGGTGDDLYRVGRGTGLDVVWDYDETEGNQDTVEFGADIAIDQLWFERLDGFLAVSVIGTWDRVYVMDWDTGPASQIEQFRTADGHALLSTQVDTLIEAMAAFTAPSGSTKVLPDTYRDALLPLITSTWSSVPV